MSKYIAARTGTKKDSQRLKKLRLEKGWTQRKTAEEFYVSPGTIALWETGERRISGPALRLIEIFEKQTEEEL